MNYNYFERNKNGLIKMFMIGGFYAKDYNVQV